MNNFSIIDKRQTNFMKDTIYMPLTVSEIRQKFWHLETDHTVKFADFTTEYISKKWDVDFEDLKVNPYQVHDIVSYQNKLFIVTEIVNKDHVVLQRNLTNNVVRVVSIFKISEPLGDKKRGRL